MKNKLLIVSVLFASFSGAEPLTCETVDELAGKIMEARQGGVTAAKLIEIANGSDLITSLTMAAFEFRRYSTEEHKKMVINDFRNKWYLTCMEMSQK